MTLAAPTPPARFAAGFETSALSAAVFAESAVFLLTGLELRLRRNPFFFCL